MLLADTPLPWPFDGLSLPFCCCAEGPVQGTGRESLGRTSVRHSQAEGPRSRASVHKGGSIIGDAVETGGISRRGTVSGPSGRQSIAVAPYKRRSSVSASDNGSFGLWAEAAEVVSATARSNEEGRTGRTDRDREKDVLEALAADPDGAKRLVEGFVKRALVGLEVGLLRLTPPSAAHGGAGPGAPPAPVPPPLTGHVRLSQDLEALLLRAAGRERTILLKEVARVFAGLHAGRREAAAAAGAPSGRCATLELAAGSCVVLSLKDEALRDEFVLCILVLTDAARGRTLRLSSREEEDAGEEADAEARYSSEFKSGDVNHCSAGS